MTMKITRTLLFALFATPLYTEAKNLRQKAAESRIDLSSPGLTGDLHREGITSSLDCTLVLTETQFEDGKEEQEWECEIDPLISGQFLELNVHYSPDYKDPEAGLFNSGVTTFHSDRALVSESKVIVRETPKISQKSQGRHGRRLATIGTRNVLVVRIQAKDVSTSPTEEDLAREVFGITNSNDNTNSWNLSSAFNQCSYGNLKLEPAEDGHAKHGVYTVVINQNVRGQRHVDIRNIALDTLRSELGTTDLNSLYDHVMLCLPPGTTTKTGKIQFLGDL